MYINAKSQNAACLCCTERIDRDLNLFCAPTPNKALGRVASPSPRTPALRPSVEATQRTPKDRSFGVLIGAMQMTIADYFAIGVLMVLVGWAVAHWIPRGKL